MIGVLTWGARMPEGFPIRVPQNSGNMVHAQAPFRMFANSVGQEFGFRAEGFNSFREFVNERCSALIVPFANTIRTDPKTDERGWRHVQSLQEYDVPIIPFGLGAQAPSMDIDAFELGPGMAAFVEFLSERSPAISVRGEFTRQVFEKYGSVDNVHVTGCPSFFSRPEAFGELRARLEEATVFERVAFAGSLHHLPESKAQLYRALNEDLYLIEPVNAVLHQYYLDCLNDLEDTKSPYFFSGLLQDEAWNLARLREYMIRRYRLFRDLETWLEFNRETLDGTVGTRFHVNMASILSGVPAVWIVHDSRTQELCDRLFLPHVTANEASRMTYRDLLGAADYEPMFANLDENFERFNAFLLAAGLPQLTATP